MWHYVGHSLCWCVWVPIRESLCLLWRETHTKGLSAISTARPEVDEGRKVPEKTERLSWQRRAEEGSREIKAGQRREKNRGQKDWLLRPVDLQRPGWPTREDKSALLVALWEFSLAYTFALAHRIPQKLSQTSPFLALGVNPSPCLFVCSFLPPSRLCFAYL